MIKYLSLKNIGKLVCALIVIILVIAGIKYPKQIKRLIKRLVQREYLNQDSSCSKCGILFQDQIPVHENAYKYEGIKPKNDFDDLQKLIENPNLCHLGKEHWFAYWRKLLKKLWVRNF